MNVTMDSSVSKANHSDKTASGAVSCSIVIVCFHSLRELGPCIDMLRAGPPGAGVEVIVVNNAQSDAAGVAACFDRKESGRQLQ